MKFPRILLSLVLLSATSLSAASRPNVITLLVDDLGYRDLGCYGGPVKTPVLDKLAAEGVRFTYVSPAGEEGYPGTLTNAVTYLLNDQDELSIEYESTCDAATPVNLTHHSYFNLAGHGAHTVLHHVLEVDAGLYPATDDTLIPTGELASVAGTPLDFTTPRVIGERVSALDDTAALGYDHNFVLNRDVVADAAGRALVLAAEVFDPGSGRVLEVLTTEPGVQFYSGNFLDGTITGKNGEPYESRSGFCLETQHYPDSPNQRSFPSTILRPGETYHSRTEFRFSIR